MLATITINNVTIDVLENFPLNYNIGMELNDSTVSYKESAETDRTVYSKYTLVLLNIDGVQFKMAIIGQNYILKNDIRIETLILCEMTKILEEIWVNGMAVTYNSSVSTLKGQIEIALDKIMIANPTFNILLDSATSWTSFLDSPTEMFIYSKDWNAREILDDMFSVLKLEVKVTDISYHYGIATIKISYDDPNLRLNDLNSTDPTFVDEAISYNNNIDFLNDVGGIKSVAESSVSSNLIETPYLPLRDPSSGLYNTAEQLLITEKEIYSFISLTCYALTEVYVWNSNTSSWEQTGWEFNYLDLTEKVLEKEYFDTLVDYGASTGPYKYTSLYFERGKKNVFNWYNKYEQFGFNDYVIVNIDDLLEPLIVAGVSKRVYHIKEMSYSPNLNANFVNYIPTFSIKYQANGISYFDELKNNISSMSLIKYGTRLVDNSAGNNVDIERYGESLINKINRIGNREITLDYFHSAFYDVKNLGDYFNGFVLTKIEAKINNSGIYVRYQFNKNYIGINEKISLRKQKETFSIPTSGYVDRYIPIELSVGEEIPDVVSIKTKSVSSLSQMPSYTGFLQTRKYETSNTEYAIAEPLDNYSIGIIKTTNGNNDISTNLSYVSNNGEAYYFDLKGYSNSVLDAISFSNYSESYPKIDDSFSAETLFTRNDMAIKKDRYEKIIFVFIKRK